LWDFNQFRSFLSDSVFLKLKLMTIITYPLTITEEISILFTITLEVTKQPLDTEVGSPSIDLIATPLDFTSTSLSNPHKNAIEHVVKSANLTIWERFSTTPAETTIKVEPALIELYEDSVGKELTVSVRIINVQNLYGFDIGLRWNTTFLEHLSHSVRTPRDTYSDGVLNNPIIGPLTDLVNSTAGTFEIANLFSDFDILNSEINYSGQKAFRVPITICCSLGVTGGIVLLCTGLIVNTIKKNDRHAVSIDAGNRGNGGINGKVKIVT
jgi:hypothetical protein